MAQALIYKQFFLTMFQEIILILIWNFLSQGYEYAFRFAFYDSALSSWQEQRETFKFRVEEYEY
jgi:hypothetical protein